MMTSYNKEQKYVEQNMPGFRNAFTSLRENTILLNIDETPASTQNFKELTSKIISADLENESKNKLMDLIEVWSIDLRQLSCEKDITAYCFNNQDIESVYFVTIDNKKELIIIVDDICSEAVFDHNTFAFELRAINNEIYDFMVLDNNSLNGMMSLISDMKEVYKRGFKGAEI